MSIGDTLTVAHRAAASAIGALSLAIERRSVGRETAQRIVRQLREAADAIEMSVLKRGENK